MTDAARRDGEAHDGALPIVVVGGGLTGVEVAAEMAKVRPHGSVTLVAGGGLVPTAGASGARSVARRLRRLGVDVVDGTTASEVSDSKVTLAKTSARNWLTASSGLR